MTRKMFSPALAALKRTGAKMDECRGLSNRSNNTRGMKEKREDIWREISAHHQHVHGGVEQQANELNQVVRRKAE